MVNLEHVIEFLAYDGEGAPDTSVPFNACEQFQKAKKAFLSTIRCGEVSYADLECAGIAYAATAETLGFNRGFRAGVKMVLDLFAVGRLESGQLI